MGSLQSFHYQRTRPVAAILAVAIRKSSHCLQTHRVAVVVKMAAGETIAVAERKAVAIAIVTVAMTTTTLVTVTRKSSHYPLTHQMATPATTITAIMTTPAPTTQTRSFSPCSTTPPTPSMTVKAATKKAASRRAALREEPPTSSHFLTPPALRPRHPPPSRHSRHWNSPPRVPPQPRERVPKPRNPISRRLSRINIIPRILLNLRGWNLLRARCLAISIRRRNSRRYFPPNLWRWRRYRP